MLTRLTPLDGETILPLAEAKASQRILSHAEDGLLATFRDAAVGHIERISGVALSEAGFRWTMRSFGACVELPMGPVTAIDAVLHHDSAGVETEFADFRLVGDRLLPAVGSTWPLSYGYAAVEFTAGLEAATGAPELIMAAKLLFGHFYRNREASGDADLKEVPLGVQALVDSYRQVRV